MKTPLRTMCLGLATLGMTGCQAQSPVQAEPQDGAVAFARYGSWTISPSGSEMFDNQLTCAAVASLPGSPDAIRIERVADGYVFGLNGFDRESFGSGGEYPLAYWFDDNVAKRTTVTGRFVKDPAIELDDWLSVYHPASDTEGAFNAIYSADTITFEVKNPGNRTGNDAVRTTFPLGTFEVVQRSLDRCYEMSMRHAEANEAPLPPCKDDGTRLPLTGLCMGAATALLKIAPGEELDATDEECTWVVNDSWAGGMHLLYRARRCGERIARLAGSAGAQKLELELIESPSASDDPVFGKLAEPVPFADVFVRFKPTPAEDVAARALGGLEGKVPASCAVRKAEGMADAFVVDVSPAERAREPEDEPPAHLCGDYGFGDDADVWRVFQGHAWFLKLGQDAPEIDYRSLTLVESDDKGGWRAVR